MRRSIIRDAGARLRRFFAKKGPSGNAPDQPLLAIRHVGFGRAIGFASLEDFPADDQQLSCESDDAALVTETSALAAIESAEGPIVIASDDVRGLHQNAAKLRTTVLADVAPKVRGPGLMHGRIQSGVASHLFRRSKSVGISQKGKDRDGGRQTDAGDGEKQLDHRFVLGSPSQLRFNPRNLLIQMNQLAMGALDDKTVAGRQARERLGRDSAGIASARKRVAMSPQNGFRLVDEAPAGAHQSFPKTKEVA